MSKYEGYRIVGSVEQLDVLEFNEINSIDPLEQYINNEDKLNSIIELQERMARGMYMIQQCNKVLDAANEGKYIPYDTFTAWVSRRKVLWTQWHSLKGECAALIGEDTYLWVKYFELVDEVLVPYYTSSDAEQIDNQDNNKLSSWESMEDSCEDELKSRVYEDRPLSKSEMVQVRTGGYVPPCKDLVPSMKEEWNMMVDEQNDTYQGIIIDSIK